MFSKHNTESSEEDTAFYSETFDSVSAESNFLKSTIIDMISINTYKQTAPMLIVSSDTLNLNLAVNITAFQIIIAKITNKPFLLTVYMIIPPIIFKA